MSHRTSKQSCKTCFSRNLQHDKASCPETFFLISLKGNFITVKLKSAETETNEKTPTVKPLTGFYGSFYFTFLSSVFQEIRNLDISLWYIAGKSSLCRLEIRLLERRLLEGWLLKTCRLLWFLNRLLLWSCLSSYCSSCSCCFFYLLIRWLFWLFHHPDQ